MPAPVTIKGWLYKRGNDGLKLWKKRYFVLSEYCLSYYKGAHDEKASGTILLPSYRYLEIVLFLILIDIVVIFMLYILPFLFPYQHFR